MSTILPYSDEYFMRQALDEAALAYEAGEVPIGAVVVCRGQIIARAHNEVERLSDPTAHAEVLAVTAATEYMGSKFLPDCQLYVTVRLPTLCARPLPPSCQDTWRTACRRGARADAALLRSTPIASVYRISYHISAP